MPRRASKWIIHEVKNKDTNKVTWDLSRGGRYMYQNLASKPEVLQRLKNHHKSGEPVIFEEADGYRSNITQSLRKAKIIDG